MKTVFALIIALTAVTAVLVMPVPARAANNTSSSASSSSSDISGKYLKQAREYRAEGRYELARQSYAQALSTCSDGRELEIIKQEMGGVELLLRSLR